ncbi:MAG: PspC domain-containing protein [Bacteroidia bacterium]|jgi:phage shock protein PspC (stress-responsive transcriptional regulator)|nr:PspC domain-containing protein [Bacteroidota bacterium]MBP6512369.1 PspC domain-containing protein [Bacteroidia bacterium]MBP7244966.1 PspC domain-containing protein [Bacteroidia bacterium]
MNKTVTVNIGGMVFHIEEQAYDQLKKYLEAIRGYFTSSDGRDEIIQDIESRVAEMFTERIGNNRQVVIASDVEHVINTMGRPEQVAGTDEENSENKSSSGTAGSTSEGRGYRRLYRDPDDKVIGGVCSGISHYIGIDPIWLRLIFAIAFFVMGTGLLLYILLLVIVPKAKTTSEKLEMKGQAINIDNIKKTIEEEVEDIKTRISGKRSSRGGSSRIANFFEAIGAIIVAAIKFFVGFIGVIIAIVLIALLFALFVTLLGMSGVIGGDSLPIFLTNFFLESWQVNTGMFALALVIGIPIIVILYRIARSLFKFKSESKLFNYSTGILFIVGMLLTIWIGINISSQFRNSNTDRIMIPIVQPQTNTLHLAAMDETFSRMEDYDDSNFSWNSDSWGINSDEDSVSFDDVELTVQRAEGNEFELVRITTSRGTNRKNAELNSRRIVYPIQQNDSIIHFAKSYIIPKGVKYRGQKIRLILKVPEGKSVFLGQEMEDVIYDIKNVTNTWDNDMVGHTWTMTARGLECLNCNLDESTSINYNYSSDHDEKVKVRVNGKNIDINSHEDTINWDNKDVKIKIDGDGVVIDAKEKR